MNTSMELLAPAGSTAAFEAAVQAGADSIYIGAPELSARALARDFTPGEMDAMLRLAKSHGVKVYMAMNSLMLDREIGKAVEVLATFAALGGDAVIVQDLGVYRLARRFFPQLPLHASTLLGATNSLTVRTFQKMGFSRIVLARELSVEEIGVIHARCPEADLEVFGHGAMCFGYSGLCCFSSFLGGKSGLRGRCVQPCRRRYRIEKRGKAEEAYLFSMNDLCTIDCLDQLAAAGVSCLKIEGRMRSANYVGTVVQAYRLALDAHAEGRETPAQSHALLAEAMGRKTGQGYYFAAPPHELLSRYHSGNIGIFLGKLRPIGRGIAGSLRLQAPLRKGDRVRLHQEATGERVSFTIKSLQVRGQETEQAHAGVEVQIALTVPAGVGDSLYKVDGAGPGVSQPAPGELLPRGRWELPKKKKDEITRKKTEIMARLPAATTLRGGPSPRLTGTRPPVPSPANRASSRSRGGKKTAPHQPAIQWWLKIDDLRQLALRQDLPAGLVSMVLTPKTYSQYSGGKAARQFQKFLVWALPPVIDEKNLVFYEEVIPRLIRRGCLAWQLGHVGQLAFFSDRPDGGSVADAREGAGATDRPDGGSVAGAREGARATGQQRERAVPGRPPKLTLYGDYTLNVMNGQAAATLRDLGLAGAQAAIEMDSQTMAQLVRDSPLPLGVTVYCRPILSLARVVAPFLSDDVTVTSPRGERFLVSKIHGKTAVLPDRNVSLLDAIDELVAMGFNRAIIDLTHQALDRRDQGRLAALVAGQEKGWRHSTFNYRGTLF